MGVGFEVSRMTPFSVCSLPRLLLVGQCEPSSIPVDQCELAAVWTGVNLQLYLWASVNLHLSL